MSISGKGRFRIGAASVIALLALAGCGGALCPPEISPLESAARYPVMTSPDTGEEYYGLARGVWVDNKRMTAFLREAVAADGVDGLVSKLQFQCGPQPAEESCVGCYTCQRAVPVRYSDIWVLRGMCVDAPPVLVQATVGPGRTVRAMTYWSSLWR